MKLGFVSAILPELPLAEVARFAAQTGYTCVELMCWPPSKAERRYAGVTHVDVTNFNTTQASEIRDLMAEADVQISALGYYPNPLAPNHEESEVAVAHIRKVIAATALLGIGRMNT